MAGYQNLFLNQGETFTTSLTLTDTNGYAYDLTNFSIASQAKTSYYSSNTVIVFNSSVLDSLNGIIQISANAASTVNISSSQLVYDVYIRDNTSNTVSRVLEGIIYVSPAVTTSLSF